MKRVKELLHRVAELFRGVERSERMLERLQSAIEEGIGKQLSVIASDIEAQKTNALKLNSALTNSEAELAKTRKALAESEAAAARLQATVDQMSDQLNGVSQEVRVLQTANQSRFDKLEQESARLRQMLLNNSQSLAWLAEQRARGQMSAPLVTPLVSVIMPTWNRGFVIERALKSLLEQNYRQWECLIVDDGSDDDTRQRLDSYLSDPRFRYFQRPHQGVGAARNFGLQEARGDIIAYLDTDNLWVPDYLTAIVSALIGDDAIESVYTAQIVRDHSTNFSYVRANEFDFDALCCENYIDMNIFAHRRSLFQRYGGFDEDLERLCDWDLILRYTENDKTRLVPVLGGIYHQFWSPDQISMTYDYHHNRYRVRSKRVRSTEVPLKVLYALWHYPQLSESYARTEIATVRRMGVEVEVWSEEDVAAPFVSEVPVHRGTLRDALARVKPDLVHSHWLDMAEKYSEDVRAAGLPLTVRGHGFEFSPALVARLDQNPTIKAAYVFPHFVGQCPGVSDKIKPMPATFDPEYYQPSLNKDRSIVLRTGCALPTKDYSTLMEVARLCPDHQFVLVLCTAYKLEEYIDEIIALKNRLDAPVEIHRDLQLEEVAPLMARAGIYLHTSGPAFGMPVSISEAMATGSCIIARRCPGAVDYIQEAGYFYDTPEEAAALIDQTARWTDQQWRQCHRRSIERAYSSFASTEILQSIVADWRRITGKNSGAEPSQKSVMHARF